MTDKNKEFVYTGGSLEVTDEMQAHFDSDGYVLVEQVLDKEELELLKVALEGNDSITKHSFELNDGENLKSRMCAWGHPGNDITGMVARSEKIALTSEKLIGGEVYHYHTKVIMKEAYTGGNWVWHQDYGYWYKNGCLFPDMLTVFIAYDKCNKSNGCLQVLRGSHKCGRIEHVPVAGQNGADLERVEHIKTVCDLVHVELNAGDALFFHCNLLHKSEQNRSPFRRWAFLTAYNKASNNPVKAHHHPFYTPLDIVENAAIKNCKNFADMTGKEFLDPAKSETLQADQKINTKD